MPLAFMSSLTSFNSILLVNGIGTDCPFPFAASFVFLLHAFFVWAVVCHPNEDRAILFSVLVLDWEDVLGWVDRVLVMDDSGT